MRPEEELGLLLKTRREELGLSIDDVVQETKIRSKYLLAIETGEFQVIPGEVYLRGFIRSYAKFLNLDSAQLMAYLPETDSHADKSSEIKEPAVSSKIREPYSYWENLPSRRTRPSDNDGSTLRGILRIVKIMALIAAILFSLNYVYENIVLRNLPDPVNNGGNEEPGGNDGQEEPEEPEQPQVEIVIISDTAGNAAVEVKAEQLEMTIRATARCWLRVQTDDNPAESQTMEAGDEASFTAVSSIVMRAGNSGGINIYLHDELLDVSSRNGGVKNYTITLTP